MVNEESPDNAPGFPAVADRIIRLPAITRMIDKMAAAAGRLWGPGQRQKWPWMTAARAAKIQGWTGRTAQVRPIPLARR
jgi:hypothetical protein